MSGPEFSDRGTGVSPVGYGEQAGGVGMPPHGQDAHATEEDDCGTGVSPVGYGEQVGGVGMPPHGQDAHATEEGSPDKHAQYQSAFDESTLRIRHGAYLPHWRCEGATYAVTFRLGDSLPKKVLDTWVQERNDIIDTARQLGRPLSRCEEERLHELHSEKVEAYLDAGHGVCWMRDERIAGLIADALKFFDGERYDLLAWCVLPNHVHVVVYPRTGNELSDIVHSWKSFTAKQANRQLGRNGQFWQAESYDHLIRNEKEFFHSIQYVLDNPRLAGLREWKWVGCVLEG